MKRFLMLPCNASDKLHLTLGGEFHGLSSKDRVYPVVENLEKSWNSIIFSRPGKVMEIDSRFWKTHKKSWKLKGIF